MNSAIFWDIKPCSPLKVNRHFGGMYRLHIQDQEYVWQDTSRNLIASKSRILGPSQ
jgi:hypothetical protein